MNMEPEYIEELSEEEIEMLYNESRATSFELYEEDIELDELHLDGYYALPEDL